MCGRHGGHPSPIEVQASASGDATIRGDGRTTRRSSLPRTAVCGRRGGHPSHADVATGFTPGRIARTDRTQGHNRGVNPLATWKCGRRGGHPSRLKSKASASGDATIRGRWADDAEVVPPPLKCKASARGDATIGGNVRTTRRSSLPIKVQGLRKRRRHDWGDVRTKRAQPCLVGEI
jgi:hypothetical protein